MTATAEQPPEAITTEPTPESPESALTEGVAAETEKAAIESHAAEEVKMPLHMKALWGVFGAVTTGIFLAKKFLGLVEGGSKSVEEGKVSFGGGGGSAKKDDHGGGGHH